MSRRTIFIINNLFIFITTVIAAAVAMTYGSRGTRIDDTVTEHWQQIVTFTVLSNIFLAIVALVTAILAIRKSSLSTTAVSWYLVATTATSVTCLTVLFFLAPARAMRGQNYFDMILEPMFFLHFFNPILAAITYIFLTGDRPVARRARCLATLPVIVYAIPYILFVVIMQIWPDFYGVTFGGRYYLTPLVFVAFWLLAFGSASLLNFCRTRQIKSSFSS